MPTWTKPPARRTLRVAMFRQAGWIGVLSGHRRSYDPFTKNDAGGTPASQLLSEYKTFSAWLRQLFRHDWVVYSKRPFGGAEHVGSYTHRVAISNHRLVSFVDEKVAFRWRDTRIRTKNV